MLGQPYRESVTFNSQLNQHPNPGLPSREFLFLLLSHMSASLSVP
jgi:hypothetical protein